MTTRWKWASSGTLTIPVIQVWLFSRLHVYNMIQWYSGTWYCDLLWWNDWCRRSQQMYTCICYEHNAYVRLFLPEASWIVPTVVSLLLVLISMHLVHKSGAGFVYEMSERGRWIGEDNTSKEVYLAEPLVGGLWPGQAKGMDVLEVRMNSWRLENAPTCVLCFPSRAKRQRVRERRLIFMATCFVGLMGTKFLGSKSTKNSLGFTSHHQLVASPKQNSWGGDGRVLRTGLKPGGLVQRRSRRTEDQHEGSWASRCWWFETLFFFWRNNTFEL